MLEMKYLLFSFQGLKKNRHTSKSSHCSGVIHQVNLQELLEAGGCVYRDYTAHGEQTKQAMWIQVTEETTKAAGSLTVYSKQNDQSVNASFVSYTHSYSTRLN